MNPYWQPVLKQLLDEVTNHQLVCRSDAEAARLLVLEEADLRLAVTNGQLRPISRGVNSRNRRFTSAALLEYLLKRAVRDDEITTLEARVAALEMENARLRRIRPASRVTRKTRALVLARDGRQCRYCGRHLGPRSEVHLDHVVPVSREGSDEPDNLVVACRPCNTRKGTRLLSETRMTLRELPVREALCEARVASRAAAHEPTLAT